MGTLLRRVDAVHANQELIWELEGRTDPRFIRRRDFDEFEQMMVELSINQINNQQGDADPSGSAWGSSNKPL